MGRTYEEVDPNKDSSYYIWDVRFNVNVRQLDITSEDYLKQLGWIDSGDPLINKEIANEIITIRVPISEMIEMYKKGVSFHIVNKEDTVVIFEYIQNHLEKMAGYATNTKSLNRNNLPLNDLILMEEFADKIYNHAKYREKKYSFKGLLENQMDHLGMPTLDDVFKVEKTQEEINEENENSTRESFVDIFKAKQRRIEDLWK